MNKPDVFHIEMGKRIIQRRKMLNLSQEKLAELADVSPQLISTAERGTKAIRPENLLKISRALRVSADYLLSGEYTNKDLGTIADKMKVLSIEQAKTIEKIINECIALCDRQL